MFPDHFRSIDIKEIKFDIWFSPNFFNSKTSSVLSPIMEMILIYRVDRTKRWETWTLNVLGPQSTEQHMRVAMLTRPPLLGG